MHVALPINTRGFDLSNPLRRSESTPSNLGPHALAADDDGNFLLLRPYHGEHGPKVPVTPEYIDDGNFLLLRPYHGQ
jgi:hypothetical protein